jgi:hypothetical protein
MVHTKLETMPTDKGASVKRGGGMDGIGGGQYTYG